MLTLQRHVVNPDPAKSGPQPVDVFGITDGDDWDLATLAEDAITWKEAPRNNLTALKAPDPQFEQSPGVPLLIAGYDFDLGGDGVIDPPTDREMNPAVVTRYALDMTEYVKERLENDVDGKITILMAASNPMDFNQDGSAFFSLQAAEECDRPFLHFEQARRRETSSPRGKGRIAQRDRLPTAGKWLAELPHGLEHPGSWIPVELN